MISLARNERWLKTSEVARALRVDERTVRSHAADLGAIHIGRQLRFPPGLFGGDTATPGPLAARKTTGSDTGSLT
jgi:hypothetical protein